MRQFDEVIVAISQQRESEAELVSGIPVVALHRFRASRSKTGCRCIQGIRGSTASQCSSGPTCDSSFYQVCDPLQVVCPNGQICVRYTTDFSLYACE